VILALALATTALSASELGGLSGIGVFGSLSGASMGSTGGGLGLCLKFGSFPVIGLQYDFSNAARLALSCDYYAVDSLKLFGPVTCFIGVGAFGGFSFGSSPSADFGLRLPLGIQIWPISHCEFYIDAIPTLRFQSTMATAIGAEGGFRVHF
jgi:hypothetical protein